MVDAVLPVSDLLSIVSLERIDPERNAFRYYVLSIEPTLFEEPSLVREWGRVG
ncbi:MAG: WGR domain-containing protein, partial [Candidatus Binataceae bacterium]